MSKWKKAIFSFALLVMGCAAFAQPYFFKNIDVQDGLAQGTITGFYQDKYDYLWIGTAEGLHRYDGANFLKFRNSLRNPNSLPDNYITCLTPAGDSGLWIGMFSGAVTYFDIRTFAFDNTRIATNKLENDKSIQYLLEDKGFLWVAKEGAPLVQVNLKTKKEISTQIEGDIRVMKPTFDGRHLFVGGSFGLKAIHRKYPEENRYHPLLDSLDGMLVTDIIAHSADEAWVSVYGKGVYYLNWEEQLFQLVQFPRTRARRAITTLAIDYQNNIWAGSNGGGVFVINRKQDKVYQAVHHPAKIKSLQDDHVFHLYPTQRDEMWVGTLSGISLFDPELVPFQVESNFYYEGDVLNNNIYAISEDQPGKYWLGTLSDGLILYDTEKQAVTRAYRNLKGEGFESKAVRSIQKFAGKWWVGTRDAGLFSLDTAGKVNHHQGKNQKKISSNTVYHILPFGTKMLVSTRKGLDLYDPQTDEFTAFIPDKYGRNAIYQSMYFENGNYVLAASFRGGLIKINLDGPDKTYQVFRKNATDSFSLTSNNLMCLERWKKDSLLIGTYGGGLNVLDLKTWKFCARTEQDGLPNNAVYGIVSVDDSTIWMSTNNGLSFFNLNTDKFTNFGINYSLQDLEFNEGAFCMGSNGTVLFGGVEGLNYFTAKAVHKSKRKIPLRITRFTSVVNNLEIYDPQGRIELNHNENLVSFSFTAVDFGLNNSYKYAYKLEGFDNNWIELENQNTAYYTRLEPGTYTFKVRAKSPLNRKVVADEIEVIVHPPFWKAWWFLLSLVLLLVGLIYLIIYLRTQTVKRNYQMRMTGLELKALRGQMNPHFIFNCLNSIQYYILNKDAKAAYKYLAKFSTLMRMILQNSRHTHITLNSEIEWLKTYLEMEKLRMDDELEFQLHVDPKLDIENVMIPSMLIQPFVENAILHGLLPKKANRQLKVAFEQKNLRLKCVVEDNGIGREKAAEINAKRTKKHESAGVNVTRERLELLSEGEGESSLCFEDVTDENGNCLGTRVILILPLIEDL